MFAAWLALLAATSASVTLADDAVSIQNSSYSAGELGLAPVQSFVSSKITPPQLNYRMGYREPENPNNRPKEGHLGPLTFLTYSGGAYPDAPPAPIIFDTYSGEIVWSGQFAGGNDENVAADLKVQRYKGVPVLTYWQGEMHEAGFGRGSWTVLNQSYDQIATVSTDNKTAETADFHDMTITENDTALVETWRVVGGVDLSGVNASANLTTGYAYDCVFQEIDIESGEVLFSWSSLEHVPVSDSYVPLDGDDGATAETAYSYCALNSVDKDSAGNFLISMAHTSAVYYVNGATGDLIWTLGGVSSSYQAFGDATFSHQHDVRLRSDPGTNPRQISLFDTGARGRGGDEEQTLARGVLLALDAVAMTVSLVQQWFPSFDNVTTTHGNVDFLESGNVLIGWGQNPYASEYTMDGTLVWEVQFGATPDTPVMSYRAHTAQWRAGPSALPSLALANLSATGHVDAYFSWNGDTKVHHWKLWGCQLVSDRNSVRHAGYAWRQGFESITTANASLFDDESLDYSIDYVYVFATAHLSVLEECLGASEILEVRTGATTGFMGTCKTKQLPCRDILPQLAPVDEENAATSLRVAATSLLTLFVAAAAVS